MALESGSAPGRRARVSGTSRGDHRPGPRPLGPGFTPDRDTVTGVDPAVRGPPTTPTVATGDSSGGRVRATGGSSVTQGCNYWAAPTVPGWGCTRGAATAGANTAVVPEQCSSGDTGQARMDPIRTALETVETSGSDGLDLYDELASRLRLRTRLERLRGHVRTAREPRGAPAPSSTRNVRRSVFDESVGAAVGSSDIHQSGGEFPR